MAAKVNTKFVAVLAGSLVLVFVATAGTYFWLKNKSGDDNERRGDAFMQAGQYDKAEVEYGKSVNKQQSNVGRLVKWRDALSKITPAQQTVYEQKFGNDLRKVTRNIVILKRTDVAAYNDWFTMQEEAITSGRFDNQANLDMVAQVDDALANFDAANPGPEQSLRVYSGRALLRIITNSKDVTDAQITRARTDLEAAIKANPSDAEAVVTLLGYHATMISRATKAANLEQERAARAAYEAVIAEHATRLADNPKIATTLIRAKIDRIFTEGGLMGELTPEQRRQRSLAIEPTVKALTPDLDTAAEHLAAAPRLSADTLTDFSMLEMGIDQSAGLARTLRIASTQLQRNPDDVMLRNLLAGMLGQLGKVDEAIAEYQKIVDQPIPPLSMTGIRLFGMKGNATLAQADLSLQQWFGSADPAAKSAALERAKGYRSKLQALGVRDDVPAVLFFDAKMRVTSQDWQAANKLMSRFFESIGNQPVPDALLIHSQIYLNLNQPGAALASAERLLAVQPGNGTALRIHAQALFALERREEAIAELKALVNASPDDLEAKSILAMWEQIQNPESISDPVARDLAQLERALSGGEKVDAVEQLRAMAAKYGNDPRVVGLLAQRLVENQDKDGALAAVKAGLAAHADSEELKRLERALSAEDTVAALVQLVDEAAITDQEKLVRKYSILRAYRRNDEASQLLKSAFEKYPSDTRILELAFLEAIDRRDIDRANALADAAAKLDADNAEGLTFRARVFIVQDRLADAAATLRQATSRRTVTPEAWRLLARVQGRLGRVTDAVAAYEESLKLRPNDRETLREFIGFLSESDPLRALQTARQNNRFVEGDAAFEDLWLRLEGRVGDKNVAIAERVKREAREPKDVNNLGALSSLYLDLKDYKTSRSYIDKVRAVQDSIALALLDARWYAENRAPDKAQAVMEEYLAGQDQSKMTVEPFLAFGQFLIQRGQVDAGLKMIERGRPFQDGKRCEVDRSIGDAYSSLNRDKEAAAAYKRAIESGCEDNNNLISLRLAEISIRLRECAEADAILKRINAAGKKDNVTAMLLAADAAECIGDAKRAADTLNLAVVTYPDDPIVYVKRAEFLAKQPGADRDAFADLEAALKIRPGYPRAFQVRSAMYIARNDVKKAFDDQIAMVRANPQMMDARLEIIRELIRRDDLDGAVQLADEAVAARPGDIQILVRLSDVFRAQDKFPQGTRFAQPAWQISKEYDIGIRLIESLLNDPQGNLTQAEEVLRTFQAEISQKPALLLSRAKLLARRNAANFARIKSQVNDDLIAALDLIPVERLDQFLAWRRDARRIYTKPADQAAFFQEAGQRSLNRDIPLYFRADVLITDPATFDKGVEELKSLSESASNDTIRVLAHRLVGSSWLAKGDHQKAADAWTLGLKAFPEDWEMNNNLAYVLAKHLNKVQEAIPYGEQAVKSNATSADAQDTLGWIYLQAGKLDEAKTHLDLAINLAGATLTRIPVMIHLGNYYAARNDFEAARKVVKDVDALFEAVRNEAPAEYQTDLDALKKQIQGK
ncbi:MAG TPA: tetratricopeptide repeat protein [Phycisphaerales bacterium]|nr:tetratricopeptide repeat protein [Phycisphaerales bacterium]